MTPYIVRLDEQVHAPDLAADIASGTASVIGNFDGVHRGHQLLFAQAVREAKERRLVPVALTFDPHPSAVLGGDAPGALTSLARKAELIHRLGVTYVFVRRFERSFASWTPERFTKELVAGELSARVVISGKSFRFGKDRAGDAKMLEALGGALGFVAIATEARDEKGALSSTRARMAIVVGDLAEAESILGRLHAIEGPVVKGEMRGRTLGFPTANLDVRLQVLPPNGVYAVVVDHLADGQARALARGVMNVGVRPTVATSGQRSVEVHLFDVSEDLYGQTLRVHLVQRLRDEVRFAGQGALKAQIRLDAHEARAVTAKIQPLVDEGAPRFG
jgi:riboflavin kinase / FMN adenylyltransferase